MSQLGQSAASGISNSAIQSGAQIGNTQQALGQAQASGVVGSANAVTGGLNSATGGIATAALLSKIGGGGTNSGSLSSYLTNQGVGTGVSNGGYNYIDAAAG